MNTLILLILSLFPQDQQIEITQIRDSAVVELISSIQACNDFSTDDFSLMIHEKFNPYGSAKNNSGEITRSYYFIISDLDDYPKVSVFEIGAFYKPEIINVKPSSDVIQVEIEYYSEYQKVKKTLYVYSHRVVE